MIRVRDNPGAWWLLAILFGGVGAAFVYLGITRAIQLEWWQAPVAILMGSASVAAGARWAWRSPLSTVAVSPAEQQVRLVQIGLFGKRVQTISSSRIEDVVVERQSDDEGGAVARPALLLRDGRRIPLSALWQHDVKRISRAVATLRAAIRSCPPVEGPVEDTVEPAVDHRAERSPFAGLDDEDAEAPKAEGPPS